MSRKVLSTCQLTISTQSTSREQRDGGYGIQVEGCERIFGSFTPMQISFACATASRTGGTLVVGRFGNGHGGSTSRCVRGRWGIKGVPSTSPHVPSGRVVLTTTLGTRIYPTADRRAGWRYWRWITIATAALIDCDMFKWPLFGYVGPIGDIFELSPILEFSTRGCNRTIRDWIGCKSTPTTCQYTQWINSRKVTWTVKRCNITTVYRTPTVWSWGINQRNIASGGCTHSCWSEIEELVRICGRIGYYSNIIWITRR